jgi:hypothetical protein
LSNGTSFSVDEHNVTSKPTIINNISVTDFIFQTDVFRAIFVA